MPTYQYACTECGERMEAVQSFSDAALTDCPACSGRLRKVFSAVGVVFKGSGFYKNDSRGGSAKPATESGGSGSSDGGDKGGTKTESAPAAKSETGGAAKESGSGSGNGSRPGKEPRSGNGSRSGNESRPGKESRSGRPAATPTPTTSAPTSKSA